MVFHMSQKIIIQPAIQIHETNIDYQPSHVIIQCGGNDADRHPPHQVVREYDQLVKVRQICPQATISLSNIPRRGTDELTLVNI